MFLDLVAAPPRDMTDVQVRLARAASNFSSLSFFSAFSMYTISISIHSRANFESSSFSIFRVSLHSSSLFTPRKPCRNRDCFRSDPPKSPRVNHFHHGASRQRDSDGSQDLGEHSSTTLWIKCTDSIPA